jgi:hypothetical protein
MKNLLAARVSGKAKANGGASGPASSHSPKRPQQQQQKFSGNSKRGSLAVPVTLTASNFESEVLHSKNIWLVEVTHKLFFFNFSPSTLGFSLWLLGAVIARISNQSGTVPLSSLLVISVVFFVHAPLSPLISSLHHFFFLFTRELKFSFGFLESIALISAVAATDFLRHR